MPALSWAAMSGDENMLRMLLQHRDVDMNATWWHGMNALMEAVSVGYYASVAGVRELLANETVLEHLNVRNSARSER